MFYEVIKRILDITISLLCIILLAPVMFLIAITIKLYDGGPVFDDAPLRIGRNGKPFVMYKFRSMIVNAHDKIKTDPGLSKAFKNWSANNGKLKVNEDPRVTVVGKILRKTDLDETAQFLNVLRGEMSIVGPRPFFREELEIAYKKYPKAKEYIPKIQSVKPGITGPWQVLGRNKFSFLERFEIDARYTQRKSLLYDFYIIVRTLPAVILRYGVYE